VLIGGAALADILATLVFIIFGVVLAFFIVPPIVDTLRRIPLFGSGLADAADILFKVQIQLAKQWAARNIDPVVNVMQSVANNPLAYISVVLDYMGANLQAMIATAQAAGGAAGAVGTRLVQLALRVTGLETAQNGLTQFVNGLFNRVTNLITVTIPSAIGAAVSALSAAFTAALHIEHAFTVSGLGVATQLAQGLFAEAQLAAKAGDLVMAELLGHTAAQLAAQIVAVQAGLKTYTDVEVGQLDDALANLRDVVIPTAIAGVTVAVTEIATTLTQLERDCINPTCSALTPSLGILNLLNAGAELLFIVTLVSSIKRDPAGTARDLSGGIGDLMSIVRPVVGAMGINV
jgi:hypothetical protein